MAPKKITRGGSHSSWTISDISFEYIPKYAFNLSTSNPSATLTPSAVDGNITLTAGSSVFASGNVNDYVEAYAVSANYHANPTYSYFSGCLLG